MTNEETIQVESIMIYLENNTNDDRSHTDLNWLQMLCLNNTECDKAIKDRVIKIQERTIGYGKEK